MEFTLSDRMNCLENNIKKLSRDNSGNSKKIFFRKTCHSEKAPNFLDASRTCVDEIISIVNFTLKS